MIAELNCQSLAVTFRFTLGLQDAAWVKKETQN
jgi:hypothetical protein